MTLKQNDVNTTYYIVYIYTSCQIVLNSKTVFWMPAFIWSKIQQSSNIVKYSEECLAFIWNKSFLFKKIAQLF